jgi:hypothetical protein
MTPKERAEAVGVKLGGMTGKAVKALVKGKDYFATDE